MATIVKIKGSDGEVQYPITKPEAVMDENGKNILEIIQENGGGGCECATPDWSAPEGQNGHIKNRTHYRDNPIEDGSYDESNLSWGDTREIYPYGHKYYKVTINGESHIIDFVGKDWPQYDFEKDELNKLEYDLQFDNNVGLKLSFFQDGGGSPRLVLEYYPTDHAAPETIDVNITEYVVGFERLSDEFIPDTIARKQELTELSAEVSGLSEGIALRNVGAEDTDESVDEPEIPTPAPSASSEWKCVFDGRMEEGKSSIIYTTYADGTPLKAREAIIEVVNDIKAAADITGYVRIQSTLNKNKCSFGIITYESVSVGDGKIMVQDVRIETSEHFFTKAYIAKDMKNAIAHSSVVGEEIGHNPQIFEDIVSIELASNLLFTEAAPLVKIYAR